MMQLKLSVDGGLVGELLDASFLSTIHGNAIIDLVNKSDSYKIDEVCSARTSR